MSSNFGCIIKMVDRVIPQEYDIIKFKHFYFTKGGICARDSVKRYSGE